MPSSTLTGFVFHCENRPVSERADRKPRPIAFRAPPSACGNPSPFAWHGEGIQQVDVVS